MQNLLRLILKYNFQITFIILEFIALSLVVKDNPVPRARFFQWLENINAVFYNSYSRIGNFVSLNAENQRLIYENARLKFELSEARSIISENLSPGQFSDSLGFEIIVGKVINNSVNKTYNYLTLNKGEKDGVKPDMAVLGQDGLVGIVRNVSDHFCTVISVLNPGFRASVKLSGSGFFGSLQWDGRNYREAELIEVPSHAPVNIGDTIVTSGFSAVFPEGEMVGTVSEIGLTASGSFYRIRVSLSQDMKKLNHIYIIKNFLKMEQATLEQLTDE